MYTVNTFRALWRYLTRWRTLKRFKCFSSDRMSDPCLVVSMQCTSQHDLGEAYGEFPVGYSRFIRHHDGLSDGTELHTYASLLRTAPTIYTSNASTVVDEIQYEDAHGVLL